MERGGLRRRFGGEIGDDKILEQVPLVNCKYLELRSKFTDPIPCKLRASDDHERKNAENYSRIVVDSLIDSQLLIDQFR